MAELEEQLKAETLRADVATIHLEEARKTSVRDKELFVAMSSQTKRLETSVRALNDKKFEASSKMQKASAALKSLQVTAASEVEQRVADARVEEASRVAQELERETVAADEARVRASAAEAAASDLDAQLRVVRGRGGTEGTRHPVLSLFCSLQSTLSYVRCFFFFITT